MINLVQSRPTPNVPRRNGRSRAQTGARNFVEEDVAVVNVGGSDNSVGDDTTAAGVISIVAVQTSILKHRR